jgi:nitronate monooxygenase
MLGAQGVVLGTRFYASEEAAGHPNAKDRILSASADDTARSVVFDVARRNVWPSPYTGRCIKNSYTNRWSGRELELIRQATVEGEQFLAAQRTGDFDVAPVIAGEVVGLIQDVPSAKEIVRRMMGEAEALLRAAPRHRSRRT